MEISVQGISSTKLIDGWLWFNVIVYWLFVIRLCVLVHRNIFGKVYNLNFKSPCKKPVSVHGAEVRFQAHNSCGSNSVAVFIVRKITTKKVLNQNISAEKEAARY